MFQCESLSPSNSAIVYGIFPSNFCQHSIPVGEVPSVGAQVYLSILSDLHSLVRLVVCACFAGLGICGRGREARCWLRGRRSYVYRKVSRTNKFHT